MIREAAILTFTLAPGCWALYEACCAFYLDQHRRACEAMMAFDVVPFFREVG